MFRRKSDVDKHVKDLLRKVKNEHERNLRCYHIATMYYKAQDFDSAQKYVSMYLSVRDDSSSAHKLLGQCYEGLNLKDKALLAYRRSLELEANQAELILKICELLCDKDVEFDPIMGRYWADRASSLFPHDPSVFMLKEKLLTVDESIESNDLENLLHSELKSRPTDVLVRIKLLNLYVDSGRTELALNHAFEVEFRQAHSTNLPWYQCLSHICKAYHSETPSKCNWEFYIQWMSALDRVCSLSLSEVVQGSDLIESTEAVYSLDQLIFQTVLNKFSNPPETFKEFVKYIGAQLMFHITILLLKRAKKQGNGLWKETKRMIAPLLLLAILDAPNTTTLRNANIREAQQKILKNCINHGRCRIVQAGQMLLSLVKECQSEKRFLEQVFHFTVNNWKLQIFQKLFSSIDEFNLSSSYFLTSNSIIPQRISSHSNFKPAAFVSNFENVYVGSLHHLVWLGLQSLKNPNSVLKCKMSPTIHTTYFKTLQFTVVRLNNVGVETLNQLDIDSFLYATVFCVGMALEDQKVNGYFPPDRPLILPADISVPLCTAEQSKWWTSACSITKSGGDSLTQQKNSMSDLRHLLQRGLEVVRGENVSLPLLICLARTFSLRAAAELDKIEETEGCEARALHLWQLAIPMLERLASNQSLNKYQKTNSFFEYPMKELEMFEVSGLLEEAKYFVGCHLMKSENYEEAIENFKNLNSAQAAFNQALIYQKLAEQQINGYRGEEVTSEMRCNQAVMASKARDALHRARDMLKDNHSHPYYHKVKDKLIEVDELLSRIEPENATSNLFSLGLGEKDMYNTDCNLSCESGGSPVLITSNSRANHSHRFHPTSTPNRHYEQKFRSNSAEVVEILTMQQNTSQLKMQQVLEHLKLTLEKIDSVMFEQRSQRNLIEELANKFNNLETETKNVLSDIKKEVKRPDLYNMIEDEEYPDEMLPYQNYPSYYPPQRNVQSSSTVYGGPTMPQYFSPRVDQMYQGNVGFYNQSALPFSDGQQLPDFLRSMPPKLPASLSTPQGLASLQTSLGLSAAAASGSAQPLTGLNSMNRMPTSFHGSSALSGETNRIPTNVVITTSDTLPTGVPPVQPTLSVNIPPQHRLGDVGMPAAATGNTPGAAHQFQIPLPQQKQHQLQKSTTIIDSDDDIATSESTNQDFDISPDFKPIIPLPKEVAVVTGEEQDDVAFIGKVKLLRFADKAWKERGTGDLKILKNKTNNKARILMRKEKVHKICANHFLTPDMELLPLQQKAGAWCWTANDFSDEVVIIEKFCAKFKTVEEGLRFKEVFDKVKSGLLVPFADKELTNVFGMSPAVLSLPVTTSAAVVTTTLFTSSTLAQPITWNSSSDNKSINTASTAPIVTNKINAGGFTFTSPPKFQLPEEPKVSKTEEIKKTNSPFANLSFSVNQTSTKTAGITENTVKEPLNKISSESIKGSNLFFPNMGSSGTSSPFSVTQSDSFLSSALNKPFSETQSFSFLGAGAKVFGGSNKSSNNSKQTQQSPFQGAGSKLFGGETGSLLPSLNKSPGAKEADLTSQNTEEEFVPTATFVPVVPLPELVQVVSGEEGETVLFEERAKLYRFCNKDTKQWKERGTGLMKILKNEETEVIRLVMRRDQIFKVCCNHRLTRDIVLSPSTTSDRSYTWAAKDFSDKTEGVNEIFTLKLKTTEQALAFKKAFEQAQAMSTQDSPNKSQEQPSSNMVPLKSNYVKGTWCCPICYIYNNPEKAKCAACDSNKPGVTPEKEPITTNVFTFSVGSPQTSSFTASEEKPSLLSLIARPAGSWNCKTCYVQNKQEDSTCVACKEQKSDGTKVASATSSMLLKGAVIGDNMRNTSFGESQTSSLQPQKTIANFASGFVFEAGNNNKEDTTSVDISKAPKTVFNFGVPTANQAGPVNKSVFTFSFLSSVPTTPGIIHKHDSGSEHGDSDNEIYFQPLVPLPEKITVVTGEEDEIILYSHRAKLYRYDTNVKEWKERGVGDIKILKHSTSGKIRLLLRREPVFKISLNHYLTPDIVMKVKDDKSWIWTTKDFSSGELVQEQFAIRFKTSDIAKEFKKAVDDAQSEQIKEEKERKPIDISDGIEIVYEQTAVSEELRKKAESLMLPPNFYNYLKAKPCPGCIGCEPDEDEDDIKKTYNKDLVNTEQLSADKKTEPGSSKVVLKQSILSGIQLPSVPSKSVETVKTTSPSKIETSFTEPSTKGKENVSTGGFFKQSTFTSAVPINIFGGSAFGGLAVKSPFGFDSSTSEGEKVQPSIFGGIPSGGLSSGPTQKLFFGGGALGSGDVPSFNQPLTAGGSFGDSFNKASNTNLKGSGDLNKQNQISNIAEQTDSEKQDLTMNIFGNRETLSFANAVNSPSIFGQRLDKQVMQLPTSTTTPQKNLFGTDGSDKAADSFPLSTQSMASFSSLASSASSNQTFLRPSNNTSIWQDASVFGNNEIKSDSTKDDSTTGNEDGEEHEPYFAPVIDLPELIELTTGEEDEIVVFNERAKLYRHDSVTSTWKERGVGNMKVLKHNENNVSRLLMRRETIHKIVCNQRITADLEIKPMSTSEQAFCWFGMNMAQDYEEPKMEKLSVKFKNRDLALKFKKVVDDLISEIKT